MQSSYLFGFLKTVLASLFIFNDAFSDFEDLWINLLFRLENLKALIFGGNHILISSLSGEFSVGGGVVDVFGLAHAIQVLFALTTVHLRLAEGVLYGTLLVIFYSGDSGLSEF